MSAETAALRYADRLIWATIAATALAVGASNIAGSFRIDLTSYVTVAAACTALVITAGYYLRFRAEPKLGSALSGTAQIAAFAAVGAPLSYIAASAGLPLWDDKLVIWDRHLGLDWMAWLAAMNAHPNLHLAFRLAYMSFAVQTTTTVLALAFTNRLIHLRVFIISFMLATVVTIAISTLMPAQGVWGQLHLVTSDYPNIAPATQTSHLAVFLGLRDGSFRELMAKGSEGIITFPSLHAALGLLFMLAMWPVPYLRWVAIVLNLLMIAATPVDGGHYFTDVVAGLAIAAFSRIAATRLIERRLSAAMDEINVTEAPSIIPDTSTVSEYPAEALPQSDSRKPLKAT